MRSHVCFDAFHSDRLNLLIGVRDASRAPFLEGYWDRILFFVSSLHLWSTIRDSGCRGSRMSRTPSACWFVIFILGHTPILAWWHQFLQWDVGRPFHQVTLGISVWVSPHIQLGFFIQQLAFERWLGIRFVHIHRPSGCAHWGIPHTLSCLLIHTIGLQWYISELFFYQGTCILDVHTAAYPLSVFLWILDVAE